MSDLSDWDKSLGDKGAPAPAHYKQAPIASSHGFRTFQVQDFKGEKPKPKSVPPVPAKKKGNLKKKLAEREAEARLRALLVDQEKEEEDPVEKRKRDKERQLQADIDNAADLLGQTDIQESTDGESQEGSHGIALSGEASTQSRPSTVVDLDELLKAKPESKSDWEQLAQDIYVQIIAGYGGRVGYDRFFGPALTKLLTDKLPEADMRSIAIKLRHAAEKKVLMEKGPKFAAKSKAQAAKHASPAKAKDVKPVNTKTARPSIEPKKNIATTATVATNDVDAVDDAGDDDAQSDGSFM